jgi:hydroxymethylpyrimidine pyrophosphatase-like HAD family hydrolase
MKLSAIALDYDGTIARGDVLDASVREAIAAVRTTGVTVLLVTGRILEELRRVAGDLHFVDGIVAENGAVVYFPDSGHTSMLAPGVHERFLAELNGRAIPFRAGLSLVDCDARDGPRLLDAIRALELPLVLVFNGGRVMVLPQGVSKATGLQAALDILRLSPRNCLAIGDAENDHELLRLAEVGVAVQWGSQTLRSAADFVISGTGPPAVADFLRRFEGPTHLPVPPRARRRLLLGHTEDGREFSLAVRGRNVLVAGDAKSGKSWVAGLLCEQLILHGYCVCVIDPEGDYRSLEMLPGVTLLGGEDPPPTPRDLLRALRYPDRSVVIDLSHRAQDEKIEYIRTTLPALNRIRQETGLPHRILVDEAHYFLQDADARHLLDLDRNGYTFVSYWAGRLPKELLAATEVMIVTRESSPTEIEALCRCCAKCGQIDRPRWGTLSGLRSGQAVALPITEEAGGDFRLFTIGPRLTPHVRHREKYVDVPVTEHRAFVFTGHGRSPEYRARTLREFVRRLEHESGAHLQGYLRRNDFSRWISEVFGDRPLAEQVKELEERHRATPGVDILSDIATAIRERYDLTETEENEPIAAHAG